MVSTRAITQIKPVRYGLVALYATLSLFSLINLFWTLTPSKASNERIDNQIHQAVGIPVAERLTLLNNLRVKQEKNLARRPSEPYGWSRLSYLRLITLGDQKAAFAALRMSDLVSPYESPQLPERAVMWRKFRAIQTPEEQAYQNTLWIKAYGMQRKPTWDIAAQNGLTKEVGDVLKQKSPAFYEEWKAWAAAARN